MLHVPAATRVAVVPDTVQTKGVEDAKLTGRPDVADAVSGNVVFTVCDGIEAKVIPSPWRGVPKPPPWPGPGQVALFLWGAGDLPIPGDPASAAILAAP